MTSIQIEIESAMKLGNRLIEIYTRLRSRVGNSERTDLLRQADEAAGSLGNCLRQISAGTSEIKQDAETGAGLHALGELVERVMVQEREYRLASGACSEEDNGLKCKEEMNR